MKTVFNIPFSSDSDLVPDLLIEFGNNGVNLLFTSGDSKKIEGYQVFVFEENENYQNSMDEIFKLISFGENKVGKIKFTFNFKESILIPENLYQKELDEELIALMFGEDYNTVIQNDVISSKSIHNIYRLPILLQNHLDKNQNNKASQHSTSFQIKEVQKGSIIKCMVYHEMIKVLVYKEGSLQLVQYFNYTGPNDVTYHLLNICKQFYLNLSEVSLRLSGMIVKDSQLFQSLYNSFLNIDFMLPDNEIQLAESLNSLPLHFFSHLTELLSCE